MKRNLVKSNLPACFLRGAARPANDDFYDFAAPYGIDSERFFESKRLNNSRFLGSLESQISEQRSGA